jgi:hypothetical protein
MSDKLFEDDIRPIYSKIRDVEFSKRAKSAHRDAKRYQQVVVKVSSYGKTTRGVMAHINYISRKNDLDLEDSSGNKLTSNGQVKELMDDWFSKAETRKNARLTVNIILSAPKGSNRDAVRKATRDFAQKRFASNHEYLFAMHNDTDHPHAHLAVKLRGYDGTKLRLGRKELHELREGFAESLRGYGIAATASYRSSRGVGKKAAKQKHVHMRDRGLKLDMDKKAVKEAAADLKGKEKKSRPWEKAQKEKNDQVRREYREIGTFLQSSSDDQAKAIGQAISDYAESMPVPQTRHEALKQSIQEQAKTRRQQQERDQGRER